MRYGADEGGHYRRRPAAARKCRDQIPADAFFSEKRLQGSKMGDRLRLDIPWYCEMYLAGRLKLDELISERISLAEVNDGMQGAGSFGPGPECHRLLSRTGVRCAPRLDGSARHSAARASAAYADEAWRRSVPVRRYIAHALQELFNRLCRLGAGQRGADAEARAHV